MKKVNVLKIFEIGAIVLMLSTALGPAVTRQEFSIAGKELEDIADSGCSSCTPLIPDVAAIKYAFFGKYSEYFQLQAEEGWCTPIECVQTGSGNCELCTQMCDHDGNGPKPTELHMWLWCNIGGERILIWHIWCEDISDPDSCKCLDGCETTDAAIEFYYSIEDLISE